MRGWWPSLASERTGMNIDCASTIERALCFIVDILIFQFNILFKLNYLGVFHKWGII